MRPGDRWKPKPAVAVKRIPQLRRGMNQLRAGLFTHAGDHDRAVAMVCLVAEKALERQAAVKRVGHGEGLQQARLHAQHLRGLVDRHDRLGLGGTAASPPPREARAAEEVGRRLVEADGGVDVELQVGQQEPV